MNELNLKITNAQYLGYCQVKIDGKEVKCTKNEFGNYICKHHTESETAKIEIFKYLDCGGVLWFITQLFFFIISIFGLLYRKRDKYKAVELEFAVEAETANFGDMALNCNVPKDGVRAIEIKSNTPVREISNVYYINKKARNTFRALVVAKILTVLAIIAAVIVTVFVRF